MNLTKATIQAFRRKVWRFYRKHGRELPFRQTTDPYRITVSELMLQQTQVERVIPKYESWIKRWPNWKALSRATNREVLAEWSGLGYNRRALYLKQIASEVVGRFGGVFPNNDELLRTLPGIGEYTSRAILIFAYNRPLAAVDTNIRKVLIHELSLAPTIGFADLQMVAELVLSKQRPREWHYALMDYGALALPKILPRIPPLSRQSKFKGSLREIRGEIIRQLTTKSRVRIATVARSVGQTELRVEHAAEHLVREGVVIRARRSISLVNN